MKKIFKSLMFLVMGAFALASCEDVPAPYVVPSGDTGSLPYTSTSLNTDWTTEALNELGNPWIQGSSYTQATGYQKWDGAATKSNKECEGLLTSPALNTVSNSADGVVVAFQYILAYDDKDPQYADHIKLYVYQDNVNGTTPEMSTWTQLPLQLIPRTGSGWDVFNTESIQLPEDFVNKENVRLAFWFYAPAEKSTTYELKNFTVQDGKAGGDVDPTGKGSAEDPFEVSELQASQTGAEVWVHGYIVGSIPQAPEDVVYQLKDMTFTAENASTTNICIAQSPNETEYVNCVPVQITTAARSVLTLASVPDNLGKEVWLKGTSEKYFGSAGLKNVSKYSFTFPIDDEGGQTEEGIPVTCDEAVGLTNALTDGATSTETYTVTGYITEVVGNVSRGQQSFWMADTKDGGKVFEAYYANLPEGVEKFVKNSKVKITGQLTKYVKNGVVTPEIKNAIVEILETGDDSGQGGDEGGDDGTTSEYMSIENLPSNITLGNYGAQLVADESTWLSWTWNDVDFKAAKICKATDKYGGGIQVQGNASDASKQGFIFNSSAWSANIQKITIILKVATSSTYDPSYTLYAGSEAHPTTTAITPASQSEEVDGFRVYTQVFDLANASAKYFTIANNLAGALYIDKIYVE